MLIATLTSFFLTGIQNNPDVPSRVAEQASTKLAGGIPFVSDADLKKALGEAHVPDKTAEAIVDENSAARLTGRGTLPTLTAARCENLRARPPRTAGSLYRQAPLAGLESP